MPFANKLSHINLGRNSDLNAIIKRDPNDYAYNL